ncbi:hypothetical protein [Oerskovia paurometabola]|uniref:hypothetical protein n=1 Tax=Oerskovia paurometabola TaxID=162170 RepID=UPI00381356E2
MTDTRREDERLGAKYRVERTSDPTGKHANCGYFVLDPQHDPHAVTAMRAYSAAVRSERPALADDLDAWVGAPVSVTRREEEWVEVAGRAALDSLREFGDHPTISHRESGMIRAGVRAVLAVLPAPPVVDEAELRERIAQDIEAVDPIEWALAGQRAGEDAARIARGATR